MAIVSVLNFGADPTGSGDSTGAFIDAQKAAKGGTINIPAGDYRIDPDQLESDHPKLFWWSNKWIGEYNHGDSERCSRILPTKPGKRLVHIPSGKGNIESLVIDCEGIVDTGLYVQGHDCHLRDIRIVNATDYGAQFLGPTLTTYDIHTSDCAKGMLLQGCNGSTFIAPVATHCKGVGIEVQGGAFSTPDNKIHGGGLTILNALVSICGIDGESPLVWFRGVEGGYYQFGYLEGEADGLWVGGGPTEEDGTRNCTFIGTRAVIDKGHVLLRLQGAKMCTFISFSGPGENTESNKVIVDAANSFENEFINMSRSSRRASDPTAIVWDDQWTAFERDGRLQAESAPPLGRWEQGQVLENVRPAIGEPQGWICVSGGSPGTWRPLASIQ